LPPVKCRWRIGKYGTVDFLQQLRPNRWYNIGGGVLGVGRRNGGYIINFPLLPFWVPIASTVLRAGGTDLPQVWYVDRPIIAVH